MEPHLSLRRLEVFRLVVDERSVTRAAEILKIAQPAVSSQLRSLEEWLGAKLFVRQGNRLVLTEAGERADQWSRSVLAGAAEVRRDVDGLESGTAGALVVAASMGVGTYLLPQLLTRFREHHPGADITLNISQPQEALRQVETAEADFAVTNWEAADLFPTVRTELLREERMDLVVRADQRPPDGRLALEDALQLPLVGTPKGVAAQQDLLSRIRAVTDTEPNFVIRLGHALATKQAVVEHGWAAFAPRYVVAQEIASGVLAAVDVPGLNLRERLVLMWRRDKVFSRMQLTMMGAVRDELTVPS